MLTRLENILTFQRYEKWKVGENLGSKAHPCYIRIRVITNRVISRFKCTCKMDLSARILGIVQKGKYHVVTKFQKTYLDIWGHYRDGENTVL